MCGECLLCVFLFLFLIFFRTSLVSAIFISFPISCHCLYMYIYIYTYMYMFINAIWWDNVVVLICYLGWYLDWLAYLWLEPWHDWVSLFQQPFIACSFSSRVNSIMYFGLSIVKFKFSLSWPYYCDFPSTDFFIYILHYLETDTPSWSFGSYNLSASSVMFPEP